MNSFTGSKAVQQKGCWALGNLCEGAAKTRPPRRGRGGDEPWSRPCGSSSTTSSCRGACRAVADRRAPGEQTTSGTRGPVRRSRALQVFGVDRVVQHVGSGRATSCNNHAANAGRLGAAAAAPPSLPPWSTSRKTARCGAAAARWSRTSPPGAPETRRRSETEEPAPRWCR